MGILHEVGIVTGSYNKASSIFEKLYPDFFTLEYKTPSEYVKKYWGKYEVFCKGKEINNNINGKIFEYILATLLIRESILPLYLGAKVAFVPNVVYDLMLYTTDRGPVCISAKTSLRERYKQADLEAIALKYVHRKALSYLITLGDIEAFNVKEKIKSGAVIGLDDVVIASSKEFDNLVKSWKTLLLSEPPTVKVIEASQTITKKQIKKL